MRVMLYLITVMLSVTVISGCASQPEPKPLLNFFSVDTENPLRFSFTQEWEIPDRPERSGDATTEGHARDKGRSKGHGARDETEDQRGEMSQQLLTALDEVLDSRTFCTAGYRVLDVQRQLGRMTLIGECR